MYSDLFDALGGGNQGGSANARGSSNNDDSNNSSSNGNSPVLSFKAGKMELALQENGNFLATPDTRRCQVNLQYKDSQLEWEWYDRREKKVLDTIRITDPVKLVRTDVPKSQDADSNDRVTSKAAPSAAAGDSAAAAASGMRSPGNASTSSASTTTRQVDALSNILENLGMPQGAGAAAGAPAAAASEGSAAATRTLTLADLQSAMGGVAQQAASTNPPGLNEIVTPEAIASLLANEDVRNRLMEQLPEEQRTAEFLEENLRSPQIQQTLRSLTAALMPDDHGSMDGYHSVLANFQLDAADGQRALSQGQSPIQAFLDCVLASVEKEKAEEEKEESKDGDEEMKDE
ncbi:MAG: hypothetical protein SGARI_000309 [Bacillariaceae sp.]